MLNPRKAKRRSKVRPHDAEGSAPNEPAEGNGSSGEAVTRKPRPLPVVGIGASAGGLDAFRELLESLPSDCGMAFVIVQHLAQNQKSMLPDILARSTTMPVMEVVSATPILANHVYVMSAQADVEYAAGALVLRKREPGKKHMPSTACSSRWPRGSASSPSA
jgi:two-component system CheB/CheR fusion protein